MTKQKNERKPLSKSVRFEVFKRDGFKCQYCGASSPDVILHVDHINPVSKGGDNEVMNLVTSCADCNMGKGARELDDDSVLSKQRAQLEELSQRREQLEMMINWRDSIKSMDDDVVDLVVDEIEENMPGRSVNDAGRKNIRSWLKKYTLEEIFDAIAKSSDRHLSGPNVTDESSSAFFNAIPKICYVSKLPDNQRMIYYARGIARNRLQYCNDKMFFVLVKSAIAAGADIEEIVELCKSVRNWTELRSELEALSNE